MQSIDPVLLSTNLVRLYKFQSRNPVPPFYSPGCMRNKGPNFTFSTRTGSRLNGRLDG